MTTEASAPEVQARAQGLLHELSQLLNSNHFDMHQLRAAGVGEARIAALYPYAWVDWKAKVSKLEAAGLQLPASERVPVLSYGVMWAVLAHLSDYSIPGGEARLNQLVDPNLSYQSITQSWMLRMELTVVLLHILAEDHDPKDGSAVGYAESTGAFLTEVKALVRAVRNQTFAVAPSQDLV